MFVGAILVVACSSMERTTLLRIILTGILFLLHDKDKDVVPSKTTYTPTQLFEFRFRNIKEVYETSEQHKDIEPACVWV